MWHAHGVLVLGALALTASCGGRAEGPDSPGTGGSGNSGTGGSGNEFGTGATGGATVIGSGARGGTTAIGPGAAGAPVTIECTDVPLFGPCVDTCAAAVGEPVAVVCEGSVWVCPTGTFAVDNCSPESCARNPSICCDRVMGTTTEAACASDATTWTCPSGSKVIGSGSGCIPDGITNCGQNQGQACTLVGQQCDTGGCGCTCTCTDSLRWNCLCRLC